MIPSVSVVYVLYKTEAIDLDWVAPGVTVFLVHNDAHPLALLRADHVNVVRAGSGSNVGFGAGVNSVLTSIRTERVILCNPDTQLSRMHFSALAIGARNELLTVPLVDALGLPTSVINRYPTALSLTLTGLRLSRVLPRGSRRRRLATTVGGRWSRAHQRLETNPTGSFPLSRYWISGAVLSISTPLLLEHNGFSSEYFVYCEDIDLCARIGWANEKAVALVPDVQPGIHSVMGSSRDQNTSQVHRHYVDSLRAYARRQSGLRWRMASWALGIKH